MIYLEKAQRYMLKGDLHLHTEYSDGDILDEVMFKVIDSGLDFITVSDHDTAKGVPFAQEWFARKGLPTIIIPGCEVTGPGCHLLALGCNEDLIQSDTIENIANEIHQKGGMLTAAHPCWSRTRASFWDNRQFHDAVEAELFDGFELINYSANYDEDGDAESGNRPVIDYYKELQAKGINFPITAGSDAHKADMVGSVQLIAFPKIATADGLLNTIFKEQMSVVCWGDEVFGTPEAVAFYHEHYALFAEQEQFRKATSCTLERQEQEDKVVFEFKTAIPAGNKCQTKLYLDPKLELMKSNSDLSACTIKRAAIEPGRDTLFLGIETEHYKIFKGAISNTPSRILIESKPALRSDEIVYLVNITNNHLQPLNNAQLKLIINGKTVEFTSTIEAGEQVEYLLPNSYLLLYGKPNELMIILTADSGLVIDSQELTVMLHRVNDVNTSSKDNYLQLEQYILKDGKHPNDVEAKVKVDYDDEYLNITTVIKDDYFFQPYIGDMTYIGDSIQLGLDPRCSRTVFNMKERETFEYQLALTKQGAEARANAIPNGTKLDPKFTVNVDNNLYTYEFKLRWCDLSIKPSSGTVMGFNLMTNINDGDGRRGWLQWTPGIGDRKRAADWGWLVLN
jgi:hypothetical protein